MFKSRCRLVRKSEKCCVTACTFRNRFRLFQIFINEVRVHSVTDIEKSNKAVMYKTITPHLKASLILLEQVKCIYLFE